MESIIKCNLIYILIKFLPIFVWTLTSCEPTCINMPNFLTHRSEAHKNFVGTELITILHPFPFVKPINCISNLLLLISSMLSLFNYQFQLLKNINLT